MDALEILAKDHQAIKEFFARLDKVDRHSPQIRGEIYAELKELISQHLDIEEKVLHPAIQGFEAPRELVEEAYEDHRLIRELANNLALIPNDDVEWVAKLALLKENLENHAEEEEGELFERAREVLGADDLKELGARMISMKKQIIAGTP